MAKKEVELRRVVVGSDFSPSARHALERTALLPLDRKPIVTVVHVLPDGVARNSEVERMAIGALEDAADVVEQTARAAGREDVEIRTVLGRGRPYVETVRTAKSASADLLVVGRLGERKLRDVLLGSTAERVVREAGIPVLLVGRRPTGGYRSPGVAIDPDERIEKVVLHAVRFSDPDSATIELMHAADLPEYGMLTRGGASPDVLRDYRKEVRRRARTALDASMAALRLPHGEVSATLRTGDPRKLVPAWVEQQRFDLLIMGTHSRRGLTRMILGSTAAEVLRRVDCDTLVVPMTGGFLRRR